MLKIKIIRDNITVLEKEIPKEIITHADYWECECDSNYVHPYKKNSEQRHNEKCPKCDAIAGESPDARLEDVLGYIVQSAVK